MKLPPNRMEADTKKIPNTVLCKRIAVFISIFQPTLELLWTKGSAREIPSDRFFFFPATASSVVALI